MKKINKKILEERIDWREIKCFGKYIRISPHSYSHLENFDRQLKDLNLDKEKNKKEIEKLIHRIYAYKDRIKQSERCHICYWKDYCIYTKNHHCTQGLKLICGLDVQSSRDCVSCFENKGITVPKAWFDARRNPLESYDCSKFKGTKKE